MRRQLAEAMRLAATALVVVLRVEATLVLPDRAPRGFNSFDLQVYAKQHIGPGWNESIYRATAQAMVAQGLLARGYDTVSPIRRSVAHRISCLC